MTTLLPFPLWIAAFGVLGACIGSFLNVVILRVPKGQSIVRPPSHCDCGAPIRWYDNLPVLSFLLLRGRARCCGTRISVRYPIIEAVTAGLFVLCWLRHAPSLGLAAAGCVFLSCLLAAAVIDAEHMIIPEALTLGLGLAGFLLSLLLPELHPSPPAPFLVQSLRSGAVALGGIVIGSGLTFWIACLASSLLKRDAMGMGDVLFIGAIGAFCGWHGAVFAIFGGAVLGLLWVMLALALRRSASLASRVPFGPMLAGAAALYYLFLHTAVEAWFSQVTQLFG